jgi:hypothetical protein
MREVILDRHGRPALATHNRGSAPIDSFFASFGLEFSYCGYLGFGFILPTDHCTPWGDISYVQAFGHSMPPIVWPKARRLRCLDPRIRNAYLDKYEELITEHHLLDQIHSLLERATYPPTREDTIEYEELDKLRVSFTLEAEKKCCKLRMGGVPYSDVLQKICQSIHFFTLLCNQINGRQVSTKLLR